MSKITTMGMSKTLDDVPDPAPEPKQPMPLWLKVVIGLGGATILISAIAAFVLGS